MVLFGFAMPLPDSAPESAAEGYGLPTATAAEPVALAEGLTAAFVTRDP